MKIVLDEVIHGVLDKVLGEVFEKPIIIFRSFLYEREVLATFFYKDNIRLANILSSRLCNT